MRLFRPFALARLIYPQVLFRMPAGGKILCLTFDDGPCVGSTENILRILDSFDIKALFFCTGSAAENYPDLTGKIRSLGHVTGNHGYYHLNGLRTSLKEYRENVKAADGLTSARIFRPPYGKMTPRQYSALRNDYNIVLWDVMPYDFDPGFPASRSLETLKSHIRPGSVIVLHDSRDSSLHIYLEEFIRYSLSNGYRFGIPAHLNQYS
jgi:peptidoglycan-N-acetylglucosamine deacetylase